jgi:hypothetical protein
MPTKDRAWRELGASKLLFREGPDGDPLYVWPGYALARPGQCDARRSSHARDEVQSMISSGWC